MHCIGCMYLRKLHCCGNQMDLPSYLSALRPNFGVLLPHHRRYCAVDSGCLVQDGDALVAIQGASWLLGWLTMHGRVL